MAKIFSNIILFRFFEKLLFRTRAVRGTHFLIVVAMIPSYLDLTTRAYAGLSFLQAAMVMERARNPPFPDQITVLPEWDATRVIEAPGFVFIPGGSGFFRPAAGGTSWESPETQVSRAALKKITGRKVFDHIPNASVI